LVAKVNRSKLKPDIGVISLYSATKLGQKGKKMEINPLEAGRLEINPAGKFKNPRKDSEFHGMATNLYMIGKWTEERLVAHDHKVLSEKYMSSEKYQTEIANRRYARRILTAELAEKRALAAAEAEERIRQANEKRALALAEKARRTG